MQFLVHAMVEIWYVGRLLENFGTYGFGLTWSNWFLIHHVLSAVLFIAGAALGFWQGKFWWVRLYDGRGQRIKTI